MLEFGAVPVFQRTRTDAPAGLQGFDRRLGEKKVAGRPARSGPFIIPPSNLHPSIVAVAPGARPQSSDFLGPGD